MRAALLEWAKQLLHFAALLSIGLLLFHLVACAGLAHALGVETAEETDAKVKAVHAALDLFGPWGSLIATGVSAVLVGANHAVRNKTRKRELAKITKQKEAP